MKRSIGWDKIIFTHVVVIGVPAILYYYLRVGGASLFWLHVLVATAYLITALMICYEATAALFRRYAGSAEEPAGASERLKKKFKDALGVSGAMAISNAFDAFEAVVGIDAVLLSLFFSMAVGLFFGIYPAYRASRLNPIDALRYE